MATERSTNTAKCTTVEFQRILLYLTGKMIDKRNAIVELKRLGAERTGVNSSYQIDSQKVWDWLEGPTYRRFLALRKIADIHELTNKAEDYYQKHVGSQVGCCVDCYR